MYNEGDHALTLRDEWRYLVKRWDELCNSMMEERVMEGSRK